MAATAEKLKTARDSCTQALTMGSVALYFSILRECEECDAITDDEWLDGLAEIEGFLWKLAK
jgi:hypothetical protein